VARRRSNVVLLNDVSLDAGLEIRSNQNRL